MNCVNCGAPASGPDCRYCGTPVRQLVPEADKAGFTTLYKMVADFSWDDDRVKAVRTFSKVGGKLTGGQIRAVLATFRWDDDRLKAARHLVPLATSRVTLLELGDLFRWDDDRARYLALVAGEPVEVEDDDSHGGGSIGCGTILVCAVLLWALYSWFN